MSEVHVGEWSGEEQRRHKRVPLHVPVECRPRGDAVLSAHCENISISGLLVRCADPFPEDTEVSLSFELPGSGRITTNARVAHMVPAVFMGLEFDGLPEESRARIERSVEATDPVAKTRS